MIMFGLAQKAEALPHVMCGRASETSLYAETYILQEGKLLSHRVAEPHMQHIKCIIEEKCIIKYSR